MTEGERHCRAAATYISGSTVSTSQISSWVRESKSWMKRSESQLQIRNGISCSSEEFAETLRRKSVENLLMTGHDVIGNSIGSSLTFSTMTLPALSSQGQQSTTPNDTSPTPSPQPSPRLSPRQQHKRDHSKNDSGCNTKESSPGLDRLDASSTEPVDFVDKVEVDHQSDRQSLGSASQASSSSASSTNRGRQPSNGASSGSGDNISRGSDSSQVDLSRSTSHDGSKDRKESRGSDRSKKKSSWYNILYPTYKSRNEDFKRIFKEVPPEERLIVDYSCAVAKEILIHGRLYVSQNFLCFYANIFRWETLITLRWKDVTAITKEKTALVIPNAILVATGSDKLFFTSFGARDKAYLMLFRVWQNALMDQQMSMQEMWQWVHSCYGQELGLTSEDEDYIEPLPLVDTSRILMEQFSEECVGSHDVEDIRPHNTAPLSTSELGSMEMSGGVPTIHTTQPTPPAVSPTSRVPSSDTCVTSADALLETDMSDTTESDHDKVPELTGFMSGSGVCTSQHEGREMTRVILPTTVDNLFTLLFTNSKFFVDFHTSRNSTNIKLSPWTSNANNEKLRTFCLTVNINQAVIGRRQSQVTEAQVVLKCSKPGQLYAVESETHNAGIPYADSFYVATHYCLSKVSETESSLVVYADVKYKKSVWGVIKGFIEKHSWAGLEEFYASQTKALQAECGGDVDIPGQETDTAPKRRRRVRSASRRVSSTRLVDEALAPRSRSSIGRRSLPRGSVGAADRNIDSLGTRQMVGPTSSGVDTINVVILSILIILLLLNGALYYKLICLERWSMADPIPAILNVDLQALSRNPPSTQEEWMRLLRQQESLHNLEMQKWQKVLQSSVALLRQTEDSLKELQINIQPRIKHKLTSVIEELSNLDEREEPRVEL